MPYNDSYVNAIQGERIVDRVEAGRVFDQVQAEADAVEQRKIAMYGFADIEGYWDSIPDFTDKEMAVASILSDVQEEILRGMNETARQHLNVAKYIVIRIMRERRSGQDND